MACSRAGVFPEFPAPGSVSSVICLAACSGKLPVLSVYLEALILLQDDFSLDLEPDGASALCVKGDAECERSQDLLGVSLCACPSHHPGNHCKHSHMLHAAERRTEAKALRRFIAPRKVAFTITDLLHSDS